MGGRRRGVRASAGTLVARLTAKALFGSGGGGLADLYRREGEKVLIFLARRTWDAEIALELMAGTTFAVTNIVRSPRPVAPGAENLRWSAVTGRWQVMESTRSLPDPDDSCLVQRRCGVRWSTVAEACE